jgi:hypothetical protein
MPSGPLLHFAVIPDVPGQHVLERTAVLVSESGGVEARFTVGLPGKAR